ncbi:dienelactone hydrolase family protein [Granulicella sp. 5B5]|uniref:dienelactone hydrolase family protein n=1 Tax=Granulicella sp. 5B5 TaxID=1617967 RepID=UPI0015F4B5E7|nr:dienelactone hydrolase family protein [Granulicella sp. 5B5]QMV18418.1 dienelactone hydrolase family protein [Granulicella sp. 5B5]
MNRVLLSGVACVAVALSSVAGIGGTRAEAQDWARTALDKSPRHSEYVTIQEASGRKLQAFVVYPEVKDKAPVIVLIHEIFGESDWFKEMADELAGAGYIVVAPDLLSGWGPNAVAAKPMAGMGGDDHMHRAPGAPGAAYEAAMPGGTSAFPDQSAVVHAVTSLPDSEIMGDLDAAADYGKKLPSANGRLFIAGFCWGGGKSFLYATHRKDLSAAFVFYGTPPPVDAMKNITAPVYGFYAGNDARISTTVPQTETDMKAAGKTYEPVIYDGAGHGFMRAGEAPDASAANLAARREAFQRLVKLLGGVR